MRLLRPISLIGPIGPIRSIALATILATFLFASPVQAQTNSTQSNNPLVGFVSQILTLNNPVKLENPKEDFKVSETPTFDLSVPQKTDEAVGEIKEKEFKTKDEKISAYFVFENTTAQIPAEIKKDAQGQFIVSLPVDSEEYRLRHGSYTLQVSAKESFVYTRNLTQNFTWGVLAINTNKSIYSPEEVANLTIGVLNETGSTVCDAKLTLTIADPSGKETVIKTSSGSSGSSDSSDPSDSSDSSDSGVITRNPACGNSYTPEPDYATSYQTNKAGRYYMHIEAETKNGKHAITDYFEVQENVPFDVERVNFPTRIYPAAAYDVELKIKANQNYQGEVSDTVLKSFKVTNISNSGTITEEANFESISPSAEVVSQDNKVWEKIPEKSELVYANTDNLDKSPTTIIWNVDWKQGETYALSYTLNFPPVSPEYYLIGPFKVGSSPVIANTPPVIASDSEAISNGIAASPSAPRNDNVVFSEIRSWQIASDATVCWAGTVDANWSTANNWVTTGGVAATITSADIAVFDSSATTCSSGGTNNNSTIDATFGGSIQAVSILTYTGTITQSRSLAITTGGVTVGFVQSASSSTYNQGANTITATTVATSDFSLSNGTFNGGSGNIIFSDDWSQSGGTFNDGTGTFTTEDDWTYTSGTFTANEGTFLFDAEADNATTITGSVTFNNLTFSEDGTGASSTHTIASGTTLTVSGTLTMTDSDATTDVCSINGPGAISAQGAITTTGEGCRGTAVITINGTGSQTFTGEADTDTGVPDININKSSGTLSFVNAVVATNNWTYTTGTLSMGSSTIVFNAAADDSATVTGTMTFNSLTFYTDSAGASNTFTIASGTTLTVSGTLTMTNIAVVDTCSINTGAILAQGAITTTGIGCFGSSVITINGTGDQTFTGEADTDTNVPLIVINKSSGTLSFVSTIVVIDSWTYAQGTLSMGTSTIALEAGTDNAFTVTGSTTFNNLNFYEDGLGGSSTFTITSGTTLTVSGTLTITDSIAASDACVVNGPGTVSAQGAITAVGEGCRGTALINILGTSDQTFTGEADTNTLVPAVNINKPSGTLSFVNTIVVTDNWTYTTGTLSMGSSTVILNPLADDSITVTGAMSFNNLTFLEDGTGGTSTHTIASGATLTVSGTLTLSDSQVAADACNINGPGTLIAQGDLTTTGEGCAGNVTVTLTGTASQAINAASTLSFPTGTFTVNKSSGVATLAANFSVNTAGQDLYIRSGTLSLASFNLTVNDVFNIEPSGTLRLRGVETVSTIDSNTGTLEFTGDGDGVADNPFSTITTYGTTIGNLTINSTDTGANRDVFVLGAALDVDGNVTITAGNLDVSATSYGLTVGGNFANSDVFTQRSGTVTFDTAGNSSTISGSTTFNNFTCTTAGKAGLFFTAGTTQTISGTFTITGSAGSLVGLVSTTTSAATINATGTASVAYAAIKYITATTAFTASTSYNNGNNTSITFTDEAGAGTPVTRIKGGTTINGGTYIKTN